MYNLFSALLTFSTVNALNTYISDNETSWESTSDFIPINSSHDAHYGHIRLWDHMKMFVDVEFHGRVNTNLSLNKYEQMFRVGFPAYTVGAEGANSRYPSLWLSNQANVFHFSLSHSNSAGWGKSFHSLALVPRTTYSVHIEWNDTWVYFAVNGSELWNRDRNYPTTPGHIGSLLNVYIASDSPPNTEPYIIANVTLRNILIETTPPPTIDPTFQPTLEPTVEPTNIPTNDPTNEPTNNPSNDPSTSSPTNNPTSYPTVRPTAQPTADPSVQPINTVITTFEPTTTPTVEQTEIITSGNISTTEPVIDTTITNTTVYIVAEETSIDLLPTNGTDVESVSDDSDPVRDLIFLTAAACVACIICSLIVAVMMRYGAPKEEAPPPQPPQPGGEIDHEEAPKAEKPPDISLPTGVEGNAHELSTPAINTLPESSNDTVDPQQNTPSKDGEDDSEFSEHEIAEIRDTLKDNDDGDDYDDDTRQSSDDIDLAPLAQMELIEICDAMNDNESETLQPGYSWIALTLLQIAPQHHRIYLNNFKRQNLSEDRFSELTDRDLKKLIPDEAVRNEFEKLLTIWQIDQQFPR